MKINVNEQAKQFYLATEKEWQPVFGHEVTIGDHRFSMVAIKNKIVVSEVTTGAKTYVYHLNVIDTLISASKEGTMELYKKVAEKMREIVTKHGNFDEMVKLVKEQVNNKLGEMPPIVDVDEGMILADLVVSADQ